MEIIEIKKKAILLDADEVEKLEILIMRSVRNLHDDEDDLKRFAEFFGIKLEEL